MPKMLENVSWEKIKTRILREVSDFNLHNS